MLTTEEYYLTDAMGRTVAIKDLQHNSWEYYVSTNERDARLKPGTANGARFSEEEAQFFVYDHLGNTRITYTPIQVAGTYTINRIDYVADYFPYGKVLREFVYDKQEKYLTTQHERDKETGLDYRGARYYDGDLGRFLSVDPLAASYLPWSTYNYVFGNPIYFTDPTGKAAEDFVMRKNGTIYWDKDANSQATTKEGETYLGKDLKFVFQSFIDPELWDGPLGDIPAGVKLTSIITLKSEENEKGELTNISASYEVIPGKTPVGKPRTFYPGEGGSNNKREIEGMDYFDNGTVKYFALHFEQHASVSWEEEVGMNQMGYKIVDVAQKLDVVYTGGNLWIGSYTDIFPSATLTINGYQKMYYAQPSFTKTHTAPMSWDYLPPFFKKDFSYYPSKFYKR